MARNLLPALLLTALVAACEQPLNLPMSATATAGLSIGNAPPELPNVLRSGGRVISAFVDFEEDMAVIVGAPDDPMSDRVCGGTGLRQFIPVLWVGDFDGIVKQLAQLDAINILVYKPIPSTAAEALCATEPLAVGTGRFLRTDNDFFGFLGRANAVTELVQGTVALSNGGLANLSARFQALGTRDGQIARFETTIQLQEIAKPD